HLLVDIHRGRRLLAADVKPEPRLFDCRPEDTGNFSSEGSEFDRFVRRLNAPCFDARKLEKRVYEFEQSRGIPIDQLNISTTDRGTIGSALTQFLNGAKNQC